MGQILEESEDLLELPKLKGILSRYAVSELAKELIADLKPVRDRSLLTRLLQLCAEVKEICSRDGGLPLHGFVDIRPVLKQASISGSVLEPKDLLAVSSSAAAARNCKNFIQKRVDKTHGDPALEHTSKIVAALPTFVELEDAIKSCIDEDGEVLDDASAELKRIRRAISKLREKIREKLESIIHSSPYQKAIQEPIVTLRNDRYVIPVKQEHRGLIQGVVQGQSGSGATLFFEPISVMELNNELHQILHDEQREVRRILAQLSQKVNSEVEKLKEAIAILAELDLYSAKAQLSLDLKCSNPILNDDGYINLLKARHPLIELNLKREIQNPKSKIQNPKSKIQNPKSKIQNPNPDLPTEVVPIDVRVGLDFETLVITGPNTGGKTAALKTVGLLTLMAQCGLQIPAAEGSEIGVFSGVYADIGDEQSLEQNLSTFSSHISRIIRILGRVDNRSLVLLDEIGAGTDPSEGAALAMAILKYLSSKGAKTLVTTHYGVLKAYAHSTPNMSNGSVEFDWITLRPTYRLQVGIPGGSNALKIAGRLGLPKDIIETAKSHIDERTIEVEDLIESIEKERHNLQRELTEVQHKASAAAQSQMTYDRLQSQLKSESQKIRKQAQQEASEIVKKSRRLLENTIDQVKKEQASKSSILQAYKTINQLQKELTDHKNQSADADEAQTDLKIEELKLGSNVVIKSLNQIGEVIELPDSKGDVGIVVGNLKLKVPISDLRPSASNDIESKKSSNIAALSYFKKSQISSKLKVQGLIVQDAIEMVDKYLDDALLAGLESVSIIHGKGTGALKNAIREFLSDQTYVESFRPGEVNEGGDGVTMVKLKE